MGASSARLDWLLPGYELVPLLWKLVGLGVVFERRAEDFDSAQVRLAHPAILGAIVQVADLAEVHAHQFRRYAIGGEPIEAGQADFMIHRRATGGALAFHALVTVNHR